MFTISVRGSNDIIVGMLVLLCLYLLIHRYYTLAGLLFGLSVHLKIYPIIYGFPLIVFIFRKTNRSNRIATFLNPANWLSKSILLFFGSSAIVFFALLWSFHQLYGFDFIYESYIYHSLRVDHRHNFSFNYLFEYFHYDTLPDQKYLVRKLGFVAQWGLVIFVGTRYYYDLLSAVVIQTYIFVVFNRVVTAQYFLWYMILMPVVAVKCKPLLTWTKTIMILSIFFLAEMSVNLA